MRTKNAIIPGLLAVVLPLMMAACGGEAAPSLPPGAKAPGADASTGGASEGATTHSNLFTEADLHLGDIDPALVEKGKITYDVKCQACHSPGEKRIVGPSCKRITGQRTPEWIMEMIVDAPAILAETLAAAGIRVGEKARVRQGDAVVELVAGEDAGVAARCVRGAAGHASTAKLGAMAGAITLERV